MRSGNSRIASSPGVVALVVVVLVVVVLVVAVLVVAVLVEAVTRRHFSRSARVDAFVSWSLDLPISSFGMRRGS